MRWLRDLLATALAAALYAAAFPPLAWKGLAWVALVPWLAVLRDAPLGRRLVLGAVFTGLAGWGTGTWMPGAVSDYFGQPAVVGIGLFGLVTAGMAMPYYVAFAAAYAPLVRRGGAAAPLLAGAAWAAVELARGRLLNGTPVYLGNSPWATFGYSQVGLAPVVQIASATGVYGISFALVCVNAAAAEGLRAWRRGRPARRRAGAGLALAAAVVAGVLVFGAAVLRRADDSAPGPGVRVALVQADLPAAARWAPDGAVRTLDAYLRLTLEAFARDRPTLVLWPEAALTFFLEREDLYRRSIAAVLARHGAELVVGAPRAEGAEGGPPYTNSVYLLAPDGTLRARYDKQYLLPFMEYFPLRVDLLRRHFGRVREFTPGRATAPLPTRAGPAGILVCNEALLPQVAGERIAAGATYLVNPSNDSWVSDAGFAEQQFELSALRAVEQRAWLLRVSDSGPSAVIDPFGRVRARTRPGTRDVLLATIAPTPPHSLYGRVGDLFGMACAAVTVAALIAGRRPARARRGGGAGP